MQVLSKKRQQQAAISRAAERGLAGFDPRSVSGRVIRARTALLTGHPFFGALALSMPVEIEDVGTACTDGRSIKFDPEFVDSLKDDELVYLIAHEVGHCAMEHVFRRGDRNPARWNVAADVVINHMLDAERIGRRPEGGVSMPELYVAAGGTVEGVYSMLPPEEEGENDGEGGDEGDKGKGKRKGHGDPGRDLMEPSSEAERQQLASEWRERVVQAALQANAAGQLGDTVKRFVREMLEPKVDWRDVLSAFLVKHRTDHRTFARPNRRFISQGLYLPSVTGERLGPIVFAIDCSGSVDDAQLAAFATEVRKVHTDLAPALLTVMYFHHVVAHVDTFGPDDDLKIEPHGTGGTAFSPIFERVADMDQPPVAAVVLTDLLCDDYGPAPDYPVLWVVVPTGYKPKAPPFGDVVMMEKHK